MPPLARVVGILLALTAALTAQDRLRSLPTYAQYERMLREIPTAVRSGAVAAHWSADGRAVEYLRNGRPYRLDVETRTTSEAADSDERRPAMHGAFDAVERGRQYSSAQSPNGAYRAEYRDRNIYLSGQNGSNPIAVTTDGSASTRVKYGTASWVYGEEFEQRTAMWWSPDSRKLAFYRFDEQQVPDFHVTLNQTRLLTTLDTEAYPLAGAANPIVDLFVYDVATRRTTRIDVRDGRPFDNAVIGHYVYRVEWTADARDLIFLRTNRRQNVMEVAAANPETGSCRVLVREEWPTGWVNNDPRLIFLKGSARFIWESQRTGWNNFYLYGRDGALINPITANAFDAVAPVKIDEASGTMFYMAHDGDNAMKLQLHRVGLDGANDVRLTDPAYYHTVGACIEGLRTRIGEPLPPAPCGLAPDNRYFIDIYQTHDTPAATRIVDVTNSQPIATLATGDATKLDALGLRRAELFTFTAADGATPLHGLLQFPSTFDSARKYPLLVSVYGGPEFTSSAARETFVLPPAMAELGFLVAHLDTRAIPGIGKRSLDAIYQKLGQADVDDIAAGVRTLGERSYIDRGRVGIFGSSYGGFVSLLALLRYPALFAAASVSSPPTDWRNYDSVYSERYMGMPQENAAGYDAATAMKYIADLRGRLLLYYGTADNNVHPTNSLQLIKALQDAGKSFDLQVGPDRGHSAVNQERMLEFFVDALKP